MIANTRYRNWYVHAYLAVGSTQSGVSYLLDELYGFHSNWIICLAFVIGHGRCDHLRRSGMFGTSQVYMANMQQRFV